MTSIVRQDKLVLSYLHGSCLMEMPVWETFRTQIYWRNECEHIVVENTLSDRIISLESPQKWMSANLWFHGVR